MATHINPLQGDLQQRINMFRQLLLEHVDHRLQILSNAVAGLGAMEPLIESDAKVLALEVDYIRMIVMDVETNIKRLETDPDTLAALEEEWATERNFIGLALEAFLSVRRISREHSQPADNATDASTDDGNTGNDTGNGGEVSR